MGRGRRHRCRSEKKRRRRPERSAGGFGRDARADGPTAINGTGYQLWFIGAQRETILNGNSQPHST
jgi:hypothetical protein